jgi:glucosyl-3-phosphoglycerate phosphatase
VNRRLVLLRHAQTAWNLLDRAQGHTDVPLDDRGRRQATAAAAHLARLHPAAVWTSDLARARETAAAVAGAAGVELKVDQRLREYDVGAREGLTPAEALERFPVLRGHVELSDPPPGIPRAELWAQVEARIVPAVCEALDGLRPGELGVVVTHGGSAKVALAGLLGWGSDVATSLRGLANCHYATVEERAADGRLRLRDYGVPAISHR